MVIVFSVNGLIPFRLATNLTLCRLISCTIAENCASRYDTSRSPVLKLDSLIPVECAIAEQCFFYLKNKIGLLDL